MRYINNSISINHYYNNSMGSNMSDLGSEQMEAKIKEYVEKCHYAFSEIKNKKSIKIIYDLYFNNMNQIKDICLSNYSGLELWYHGVYFCINKNYDKMVKYYEVAVKKGNINAMISLGFYYKKHKKDYKNMTKYYVLAIDEGDSRAMTNLGVYYENQKDYENMKKYYEMASKKGESRAMTNLGNYYYKNGDYDNMMKYYEMAIEKGNSDAMNNLGIYYREKREFFKSLMHFEKATEKGHIGAKKNLESINQLDLLRLCPELI